MTELLDELSDMESQERTLGNPEGADIVLEARQAIETLSSESTIRDDKVRYLVSLIREQWGKEGYLTEDIKQTADSLINAIDSVSEDRGTDNQ